MTPTRALILGVLLAIFPGILIGIAMQPDPAKVRKEK